MICNPWSDGIRNPRYSLKEWLTIIVGVAIMYAIVEYLGISFTIWLNGL